MVNEGNRDRELHRYYQPWLESFHAQTPMPKTSRRPDGHSPQSSRDRALAAFAQLGVLRLGAKRGVVTLIDSKNQYILAEATKSLSLMDDSRHSPGDELWLGNAVLPRRQGVSQDALHPPEYKAKGPGNDEFCAPALILDDLLKHEKFKSREYAGAGIGFYAGVPLISKLGHHIGVYNITDDKPRNGINAEELRIMVDMATIIMHHLDTVRNDRARARGERLIQGIGTFIEGSVGDGSLESPEIASTGKLSDPLKGASHHRPERPKLSREKDSSFNFKGLTIADANAVAREQYSSTDEDRAVAEQRESASPIINQNASSIKLSEPRSETKPGKASSSNSYVHATPTSAPKSTSQYFTVFDRAAKILRKSMGADGVVFVDASAANLSKVTTRHSKSGSSSLRTNNFRAARKAAAKPASDTGGVLVSNGEESSSDHEASSVDLSDVVSERPSLCENISMAIRDRCASVSIQLSEHHLRRLVRRFPLGKVYSFDDQGRPLVTDDSSESGTHPDSVSPHRGNPVQGSPHARRHPKAKGILHSTIPDARTIIFLPLWDFAKERWNSAAIIWTSNPARLMNIHDDLPYLLAFGNSVMNEIARLNLSVSDTAKATFLANISHELRSPLHGILGSIEFLHDSPLDDFQSSMVTSVETCGKTLLDTVNHVLDFAKLHNLSKAPGQKHGIKQATISDSSLTSRFDLAVVVEEAVEAVYAGQVFRTANADALEGKGPALSSRRRVIMKSEPTKDRIAQGQHDFADSVRLTLNIEGGISWGVISQPGAVRRVVMNLLGNSLKYTDKGDIDVSLELDRSRHHEDDGHLHSLIRVSDTGRGMSEDFVRNHAFTAFSQEDSLASGTGLGLSIIRQIVDSLDGKIDLRSQKDMGTEVKIWLSFPVAEDPATAQDLSREDSMLYQVQARTGGMSLCMLNPYINKRHHPDTSSPSLRPMPGVKESLRSLVQRWFFMKVSTSESMDNVIRDFFVYTEPPPIEYLLHQHGDQPQGVEIPVIIICQNAFQANSLRAEGIHHLTEIGRVIEVITQPVGPQKLGKVLQRCMQRSKKLESPAAAQSRDHVPRAVHKGDDMKTPVTQSRPGVKRSAASLDRVPTRKPSEKRPGAPRSNSSVNVHENAREAAPIPVRPAPAPISQPEVNPSLPRVLAVDDNSINLQLLVTFVRKAKHPHDSAVDGLKAFEAYKKSTKSGPRYKYILMDISMPVMNGIQATKEIRRFEKEKGIHPPVKIIALTGMGDEGTAKKEAEEVGMDLFLSKPVKFKDLTALLV